MVNWKLVKEMKEVHNKRGLPGDVLPHCNINCPGCGKQFRKISETLIVCDACEIAYKQLHALRAYFSATKYRRYK